MVSPIFNTSRVQNLPKATALNASGAPTYELSPKHALAQIACTGTFNNTAYTVGEEQLKQITELAHNVDPVFLAKLAVYSRQVGLMKDMPQALLCILAKADRNLFHLVFDRVVTDGRTLRTFFQMVRSGQFGMRSLNSTIKRAINRKIAEATPTWLLGAATGSKPSYKDILRCAHFKPQNNAQRAANGWLCDYELKLWEPATYRDLPDLYKSIDRYRKAISEAEQLEILEDLTKVRWDLLSDAAKGEQVWQFFATLMGPKALRMNLNTLARHGAFNDPATAKLVASRLGDPEEVKRSRDFPFAYFMAYMEADDGVPQVVKTALHKAAEIACGNIPDVGGPLVIGIDISGSMQSAVTGNRGTATSKAKCVQVASLFGAALWRRNPDSILVPFHQSAVAHDLDPNDSLLSIADRIQKMPSGGTDCSIPLKVANTTNRPYVGCVIFSDNESWADPGRYGATATMVEWDKFKQQQRRLGRYKNPKYVGIDLQPSGIANAPESKDILNLGGFSDGVFNVLSAFYEDDSERFVRTIESVDLRPRNAREDD